MYMCIYNNIGTRLGISETWVKSEPQEDRAPSPPPIFIA